MAFKQRSSFKSSDGASAFKQMGSGRSMAEGGESPFGKHALAHYRFGNKTRKDFGRGLKGEKKYREYMAKVQAESNRKTVEDRKYHADKGNDHFGNQLLSPLQIKQNRKWIEKYGKPKWEIHKSPHGQLYEKQNHLDENNRIEESNATISRLAGGGNSGLDQRDKDYLRHFDFSNPDADWQQAADDKRTADREQKELEAQWKKDPRTKYNKEGGSRLYASDEAMKDYKHLPDLNEGFSRVTFSGMDDYDKIRTLARSKNISDQQRIKLNDMADRLRSGRMVSITFKDKNIASNWTEYDDPTTEEVENKRSISGGDYGSMTVGHDLTTRGGTDPELTRYLVGLVDTGNRMTELPSKEGNNNENQKKILDATNNENNGTPENNNTETNTNKVIKTDDEGNIDVETKDNAKKTDTEKKVDEKLDNKRRVKPMPDEDNDGIPDYVDADTGRVEYGPENKPEEVGNFSEAFRNARNAGLSEFEWNGKKFHTRRADETVEDWQNKFNTDADAPGPTPDSDTDVQIDTSEDDTADTTSADDTTDTTSADDTTEENVPQTQMSDEQLAEKAYGPTGKPQTQQTDEEMDETAYGETGGPQADMTDEELAEAAYGETGQAQSQQDDTPVDDGGDDELVLNDADDDDDDDEDA